MASHLQRLYRTKLLFLATVCTVAGIGLLLLARWAEKVPGWEWLRDLPIIDLGSALFTAGLIVIAFEYIDHEDGEVRAIHRLRQVLGEQAPAMRDAVIDGFAFKPDDLTRVASPDTLDRIARNSLPADFAGAPAARSPRSCRPAYTATRSATATPTPAMSSDDAPSPPAPTVPHRTTPPDHAAPSTSPQPTGQQRINDSGH